MPMKSLRASSRPLHHVEAEMVDRSVARVVNVRSAEQAPGRSVDRLVLFDSPVPGQAKLSPPQELRHFRVTPGAPIRPIRPMTRPGARRSPRVSIIVPAYNGEKYLGRTLDSVSAQTVTDWELIVSDDGSTDETTAIAARHANDDRRIRVVTAANGGVARARNRGLERAILVPSS